MSEYYLSTIWKTASMTFFSVIPNGKSRLKRDGVLVGRGEYASKLRLFISDIAYRSRDFNMISRVPVGVRSKLAFSRTNA